VGAEHAAQGNQRIELEKPVDRPPPELPPPHPERGNYAKPDEQDKEEDLTYAPDRYDFHKASLAKRKFTKPILFIDMFQGRF
jgi:hypothetical protein